jgi:hypothetical protein
MRSAPKPISTTRFKCRRHAHKGEIGGRLRCRLSLPSEGRGQGLSVDVIGRVSCEFDDGCVPEGNRWGEGYGGTPLNNIPLRARV